MVFNLDVKALLFEKVNDRIRAYEAEPRILTRYKTPLIGYVSADHPLFDEFYFLGVCTHPKQIFRPGSTVITYFVPFKDDITRSNHGGTFISDLWAQAMRDSIMLCAHINGTLRETLDDLGRETSGTNLPGDWNEEICGPSWSHKHAAFLAGLGSFGTAGSFHTKEGFAGCFGSVITDLPLEPSRIWPEEELLDGGKICDAIRQASFVAVSDKMSSCPAGAITKDGVDRYVCQQFCKKQDQPAPMPDVCGKCFFP